MPAATVRTVGCGARLPVRRHRHRESDKILHVADECTRESLADLVDHSLDADATVACLDKIRRPAWPASPVHPLRQRPRAHRQRPARRCRYASTGAGYIEPGSPWETPWESPTPADWRIEFNTYRLHSALGMLTPVEFADQWRRTNPPRLS